MKYIRLLAFVCAGFLLSCKLFAGPFMGGEIRLECLANGNYRVLLIIYTDCASYSVPSYNIVKSNSPAGNIPVYAYPSFPQNIEEISPQCNPDSVFNHINCASIPYNSQYLNSGAMQKHTFSSDYNYPNGIPLNNFPPSAGWIFSYDGVFGNESTNIVGSENMKFKLRTVLYPFKNQNTYPCYDNTPVSLEPPQSSYCSGYPSAFFQNTSDPDRDRLSFEWAEPESGSVNHPYIFYSSGYNYASPFPNTHHDTSNIPAKLNPNNGLITFTSKTTGAFHFVQKVSSWRENIRISDVYREFQVIIHPCDSINSPPELLVDYDPVSDTVRLINHYAIPGDTVEFSLQLYDYIPTQLINGDFQTVSLSPTGSQFGSGFTSISAGCPITPCATLSSSPPYTSGMTPMDITFQWPVTVNHLLGSNGQVLNYNPVYDFGFHIQDDYCPYPGSKTLVYHVELDIDSVAQTPSWYSIHHNIDGLTELDWDSIRDPLHIFDFNIIYVSSNPNGPWQVLDTLQNQSITSYDHFGSGANQFQRFYKMITHFDYLGSKFTMPAFNSSTIFPVAPTSACNNAIFTIEISGDIHPNDSIYIDVGNATILETSGNIFQVKVQQPGFFTYRIYKENTFGQSSHIDSILIHPEPIPKLIGPSFACPGQPVILTSSPATYYTWSTGEHTQSITLPPLNDTVSVQLSIKDQNNCEGERTFSIRLIQPYEDEEICMLSVDGLTNHPFMIWNKTPGMGTKGYNLQYASALAPNNWHPFSYKSFDDPSIQSLEYNASLEQYLFRIQVVDSCDHFSSWSNPTPQLFLSANQLGSDNHIFVTPTIKPTLLHRSTDGGPFMLLDTLLGTNSFVDPSPPGKVQTYRAEVEGYNCSDYNGNSYSSAYSNLAHIGNTGWLGNESSEMVSIYSDANRGLWVIFSKEQEEGLQLHILNSLGEYVIIEDLDFTLRKQRIALPKLPSGVYFAIIYGDKARLLGGNKFIIH